MVKFTSLVSVTKGFTADETRILACVVGGPLTNQEYVPVVAEVVVKVVIGLHEEPASRLTSMFTARPTPRLCVNVMFCVVVTPQLTAVFGDVTVIPPVATTSVTVAVCVRLPLTPVRVRR
jgi:hypothetical protein